MFDAFTDWLKVVLGLGYSYMPGQWVEASADAGTMYCVVQSDGGPAPDVEDRRPRFRVVLVGRRSNRSDGATLLADAELLMLAALDAPPPCGAASIRALGEPAGPGFTTENRAWVQVTFQVLF